MEIFEPPETRRYWVVKADAGKLYDIFIDHSLIAIGHLNSFVGEASFATPFIASSEDIKRKMTSFSGGRPYYNPNNYGQVNSTQITMAK